MSPSRPSQQPQEAFSAPEPPAAVKPPIQAPQRAPEAEEKAVAERFYLKPSEKDRATNAMYATRRETGNAKWSTFVATAVAQYTAWLEAEYNDGQPF